MISYVFLQVMHLLHGQGGLEIPVAQYHLPTSPRVVGQVPPQGGYYGCLGFTVDTVDGSEIR